jgi:hypothetical protein
MGTFLLFDDKVYAAVIQLRVRVGRFASVVRVDVDYRDRSSP